MLRKREQNIFPQKRRQVHDIVVHHSRILTFQRHMTRPIFQHEAPLESPQTPDTGAVERHFDPTLQQNAGPELLRLQLIPQGPVKLNHFVPQVKVQFGGPQFAPEFAGVLIEVSNVDFEWHVRLAFVFAADSAPRLTNTQR